MSLLRAFRGETYTTDVFSRREPSKAARTSRSRQDRNAARVLPESVGAEMSTSPPRLISFQASCWTSVAWLNERLNHSWMSGWKFMRDQSSSLLDVAAKLATLFSRLAAIERSHRPEGTGSLLCVAFTTRVWPRLQQHLLSIALQHSSTDP